MLRTTIGLTLILASSAIATEAIDALHLKQYDKAKTLLLQQPDSLDKLFYLGQIAYFEKDLDKAEQYFQQVVDNDSANAEQHYWLAKVSLSQAANASIFSAPGYARTAKQHFEKSLHVNPKHQGSLKGLIRFYLHVPGIAGGSVDKAEHYARRLQSVDQIEGTMALLNIYEHDDNEQALTTTLANTLQQHPDNARVLTKAGFIYQQRQDYRLAFDYFSQASAQYNQSQENSYALSALYQLGKTAVLSGQNLSAGQQALQSYLKQPKSPMTSELPSAAWAHYRLAQVLALTDQTNRAQAHLRQSKLRNSDDKELEKRLKQEAKKLNISL
ncbi:tetratricopeptide repeat protein [Thalassotalea sp. Y01]|uniref:tetratricopeptide repeat protein n=1 Tax=Thalassotalea sp. Y01 TaxID=2729613 RepID=UPI00145EADC0|nr:tetratricopeptide repeat protein [Thalassotalea sp. Y01]NMP17474.1 hypothetical protein [Thalassotalea sp. Y01]